MSQIKVYYLPPKNTLSVDSWYGYCLFFRGQKFTRDPGKYLECNSGPYSPSSLRYKLKNLANHKHLDVSFSYVVGKSILTY